MNTWSAYERQWRRFESWCASAGERALPADPLTVARFLADLAPVWRPALPRVSSAKCRSMRLVRVRHR
ncbi:hypothetical protein [Actinomycetospora soli]|uniref:hypothetical protein n=1 Tax=Actinomycetospora soli TaxID=2893887 RepID=UPI001E4EF25F|nr:hypothetical protein [Actinomycetospora soli]MCD2191578.1 hypothetical protein [Actinomycetospora soli]